MKKTPKKKTNGIKKVFKIFIILILLLLNLYFLNFIYEKIFKGVNMVKMYVSSNTPSVKIYSESFEEVDELYRGETLDVEDKEIINEDIKYKKINYNGNTYYIKTDNLTTEEKNVVLETELYVRTPVTVYKDNISSLILGYIPKGSKIEIIGFDKLTNGNVNMYKIRYNDDEGYIYSKYLVNSLESATENYNENGIYDIHKDRKYSYELYGGKASNLDYYPYEKAQFTNNELIEEARTLYLNGSDSVLNNIDNYISLAKKSNINAFVVDIKDGYLSYQSVVAQEYSITAYNSAPRSIDEYKVIIDKLKENDFYVIGRIVAFNDSHFAIDNPDEAISYKGQDWTSAYSRKAWEYNVLLAREAITKFGFNEIQFDYVRFPESSYSMSLNKSYDWKNKYNEEKAQAIQNFLFYATDEIHKDNAYISVDVFGECANTYVTAYGQYWPAISNIVDVISAMPYPDHFNKYDYGFKEPVWTKPYDLLIRWGAAASSRQKETPTPALVRTWIQAYDAIREPKIVYDAKMISNQISALYDSGLKNGYITWNAGSSYNKYEQISSAFKKDYR